MQPYAAMIALKPLILVLLLAPASGTLTLSANSYNKNGQFVEFQWSGITSVQESDTIALVQTEPNQLAARYPLNYIWVRQAAPDTYKAGSGSAHFWVPHHRKDLYLVYLRYPDEQNTAAAAGTFSWGSPSVKVLESTKLSPTAQLLSAPHQLRLSIQPTVSKTSFDIRVVWQSTAPGGAAVASIDKQALTWAVNTGSCTYCRTSYLSSVNTSTAEELARPSDRHHENSHWNRYRLDVDPDVEESTDPYNGAKTRDQADLQERILEVTASSNTYAQAEMCGLVANRPGWLEPGFTNYAVFGGLAPNTRFYYAVRDSQGQYSGINSFLTPPVAFKDCVHSDDLRAEDQHHHKDCFKHIAPVKMLLAADHGQNSMGDGSWLTDGAGFTTLNQFASAPSNLLGPLWPGKLYNLPDAPAGTPPVPIGNLIYSALTATGAAIWGMQPASKLVTGALNAEARSGHYHAAFINGDIVYANGLLAAWDRWLTQIEGLLSTVPTNFAAGNHENAGAGLPDASVPQGVGIPDAGGECGKVYDGRLRMPFANGVSPTQRPQYYSYTIGPIAVIVLSTDQLGSPGTTQYNWLVSTLESIAVERAQGRLPFLVVAQHRPMYADDLDQTPQVGNYWIADQLRAAWEPLFAKYEVDLVWSGHLHFYSRSHPALKGRRVMPPGSIRAPVHVTTGNAGYQGDPFLLSTTPEWMARQYLSFGFCTVEASQDHHHSELCLKCKDAVTGVYIDQVTLSKGASWRPNPVAAKAYYDTITPADPLPGIQARGQLVPYLGYLLTDGLPKLIKHQLALLVKLFGPGTTIDNLLTATPGSRLASIADLQPLYVALAKLGLAELPLLPEPSKTTFAPVAADLQYVLDANAPEGRVSELIRATALEGKGHGYGQHP